MARRILVTALICGSGCLGAHAQTPSPPAVPSVDRPEIQYSVAFNGLPSDTVADRVKASSQLVRLSATPPASVLGLRRRLRADERRIKDILESDGYYGARVVGRIEGATESLGPGSKRNVVITVFPGSQYSFASLDVGFTLDIDSPIPQIESLLTALDGKPAQAAAVVELERAILRVLSGNGYPFAQTLPRRAEVDHTRQNLNVTLSFNPGTFHSYGNVVFEGLETVETDYLNQFIPWAIGETFNVGQLSIYRQSLIDTRLFSSVKVEADQDDQAKSAEPLDVDVQVREGSHRTIGAVVRYARDEGFGGGVSWQHRNFFGQGETLALEADASELRQLAAAQITKPAFRRADQVLTSTVTLLHEDNDAFEEYSANVGVGLERDLWKTWRGRLGVSLEAAELTDPNGTDQSYLVGVPLRLVQDTTRSVLDPKSGYRIALDVTPYVGQFAGTALFTTTSVTGSYYHPLTEAERPVVVAARLKVGSIFGESAADVPANKRFYAGGGGSVRGFGYQLIGPLDESNTPFGGRSVVEAAIETRIPVTDVISVVPFVDSGLVSQDIFPSFSESVRVGAGLGGRYETPVGPFRLDIAIPLNRRSGVDNGFQFYLSFGQAF